MRKNSTCSSKSTCAAAAAMEGWMLGWRGDKEIFHLLARASLRRMTSGFQWGREKAFFPALGGELAWISGTWPMMLLLEQGRWTREEIILLKINSAEGDVKRESS
jgi:hypothetical protein